MNSWKDDFVNFFMDHTKIRAAGSLSSSEALEVYRLDYDARLFEALSKNYEATWIVLGDELFSDLAYAYIKKYPSISYTLNTYGNHFPLFLLENSDDGGVDAYQMSLFEQCFWQLFHLRESVYCSIDENAIINKKFKLKNLHLFASNLDLGFIWKNREEGVKDDYVDEIYGEFFFILFKKGMRVEALKINSRLFGFLANLKQMGTFTSLGEHHLESEDWKIVFDILSYDE